MSCWQGVACGLEQEIVVRSIILVVLRFNTTENGPNLGASGQHKPGLGCFAFTLELTDLSRQFAQNVVLLLMGKSNQMFTINKARRGSRMHYGYGYGCFAQPVARD
eukprot:scaffold269184_cov51-Prasinocladus_malaysianus.AAC.1